MQMTRYRIYTEDIGDVKGMVARYLRGATIIKARGLWGDTLEDSVVIECLSNAGVGAIKQLVTAIKIENNQQAVIYTTDQVEMEVV